MSVAIRTLIVDDDVPTRVGIRAILEAETDIHVVGEAIDGASACRLAEELAPDVILMDVQLPDFDGIEATARIMAGTAGPTAPRVIVLTTFDIDEYVYRSLEAGASGFLLKRVRAEDLVDAVRTVAAGNALAAPEATRSLVETYARLDSRRHKAFVDSLTPREVEVVVLIARGLSNDEIATHLDVSVETVRTHVKHVYTKSGSRDRAHAVIAAYESGLVSRYG